MADHPRSYRVRLPPRPTSVGRARKLVRRSLSNVGRSDLTEAAELLVSEVVTNALVHAGTPIDVALSLQDDGVRVEVADGSPHLPSRRSYGPAAGTGRGLMMLEQLVDDWGVVAEGDGKTVWFQLDGDPLAGAATSADPPMHPQSRPGRVLAVRLLNVPLLLHAAWQQHAESLLREHLLSRLDEQAPVDPIQEHADAGDAMAILAEQIPKPDISDDPDELMASAIEPHVSSPQVDLFVPAASVANFEVLNSSLEAAIALALQGEFLTPPAQPEMRRLRRWLCAEVSAQAAGSLPTPWPPDTRELSVDGPLDLPGWDPSRVRESPEAMIAADDTSRIVAASRSVLDLLGYRSPEDLEGQRLVSVIPRRFRQAHLAGFTMHVLTGRDPLLGTPIVVPALCADGEERLVELVIRSESVAGRALYLATLVAVEG
ncbi:MAG: hypothetical protein AVDCRST_MAG72-423 [uncultured Nocardioidaceae bacterium]|uniref:PAS domain-containing protein n=1 Tax=uncultured Nocardioidaceae bacterium TaxID=253824 RepID=A0A6J4LJW2_9ACTN|nr:MAG: hypothetical protein AVDCRST_MAG72-423 [uncultured Nocardioidaceae bacterium]